MLIPPACWPFAVREGRADEELNLTEGMAVTLAGSKSPTVEQHRQSR